MNDANDTDFIPRFSQNLDMCLSRFRLLLNSNPNNITESINLFIWLFILESYREFGVLLIFIFIA